MTNGPRATIGFDIDAVIRTLHREAIAAGAVAKGDGRATSALLVAEAHLHGLESTACRRMPCPIGGLCHALSEVIQYQAEVQHLKVALDAAAQTEDARKWLRTRGDRFVETLDGLVKRGEERHRLEATATLWKHNHETLCVRPAQIGRAIGEFRRSLGTFEEDLRRLPWSTELKQPGTKRRESLLLRAVCQHLFWGGFTHAEIAGLVPDGHGPRNRAGAAERVRKRVKEPDARSVLPRQPHRTPATDRKPEKRRTRRSSA